MLELLKARFPANGIRHPDLTWEETERRLAEHSDAAAVLARMEENGATASSSHSIMALIPAILSTAGEGC